MAGHGSVLGRHHDARRRCHISHSRLGGGCPQGQQGLSAAPKTTLLPLIIAVPFITGYLAMHPAINPFNYSSTMFVHVMSGNLIFILIPFTKLSHVVLFPTTQVVSEMGWHLVADSGRRVALALGKEGEAI